MNKRDGRALNRRAAVNEERWGVAEVHDNEAEIIVGEPSLSISTLKHTMNDHNSISKSCAWYEHCYNRHTAAKNTINFCR